eukprot:12374-Heterococcus_DN1.PRE.9
MQACKPSQDTVVRSTTKFHEQILRLHEFVGKIALRFTARQDALFRLCSSDCCSGSSSIQCSLQLCASGIPCENSTKISDRSLHVCRCSQADAGFDTHYEDVDEEIAELHLKAAENPAARTQRRYQTAQPTGSTGIDPMLNLQRIQKCYAQSCGLCALGRSLVVHTEQLHLHTKTAVPAVPAAARHATLLQRWRRDDVSGTLHLLQAADWVHQEEAQHQGWQRLQRELAQYSGDRTQHVISSYALIQNIRACATAKPLCIIPRRNHVPPLPLCIVTLANRCENCGWTLFPARNRHDKHFVDVKDFKCIECGAPKDQFVDIHDLSDPRNIDKSKAELDKIDAARAAAAAAGVPYEPPEP